jgi:hypothetical protein
VQEDYTIHIVLYALVAIGSPVFFLFMLLKHRTASRWIRCIFVLLAFVGVPWGVLGVLRLGYPTHFTRVTRASFYHFETLLGGFALGLLTSVLLSAEFWQIARSWHSRSNQSLEPTAGQRE